MEENTTQDYKAAVNKWFVGLGVTTSLPNRNLIRYTVQIDRREQLEREGTTIAQLRIEGYIN